METTQAIKILGIEVPTQFYKVKSAYRRLAFFVHPDRGGDPDKFREVEEAFRTLKDDASIYDTANEIIKETVNGKPLSELGKGYPLNISAKTCGDCEGRGYTVIYEKQRVECPDCLGTGDKNYPCNRCNGTGKYKRGNHVVGDCFKCNGSGRFFPKRNNRINAYEYFFGMGSSCARCRGGGEVEEDTNKVGYAVVCDSCKGIGELKMFNPVLPRGLLGTR